MRKPENRKPRPARLPDLTPPPAKPTPARELAGAEPTDGSGPREEPTELAFESGGTMWRVTLLGRSGRAHPRSPPLLLLGFAEGEGEPTREALVVAHALADLTPERLQTALDEAAPPRSADRERPFFDGTGRGHRSAEPGRNS